MHFSSGEFKYLSLSSVIATQLPQAVGAAYAARLRGDDVITFGYLGDGATSENDFHVAMNFAGVWNVPCVIICQNNHWAISVPVEQQTASETLAIKARAYGMPGIRVDGNDILAVIKATAEAAERARSGKGPTFLELVTWRRGGHSSSDDPTRYRDESKFDQWLLVDPIERFRKHLHSVKVWDQDLESACEQELRQEMERALAIAEPAEGPKLPSMFEGVYAQMPYHLRQQLESVEDDLAGTAEGAFPL
jgi:pyruvate dehydrogenase E1 component alpha subunit/2-oxoisovalerate dehydrogenase E1 component alpha subunit